MSLKPWEIVSDVLKLLEQSAKIGISTKELDGIAEARVLELGGICYNKGYAPSWTKTPFPAATCICVNDEIVHGIPSDYKLKEGDLVSFDIGVKKDGLCGDGALTVGIGEISNQDRWVLKTAKEALYAGIAVVAPGVKVRAIGSAIEHAVGIRGFVANQNFFGHQIKEDMHMGITIPHFEDTRNDQVLEEGMMICIEPAVTRKDRFGYAVNDWTWKTVDERKSAVFEHQILVTKKGCEILTTHLIRF